jgi:arylsulfatase A-like enzyme
VNPHDVGFYPNLHEQVGYQAAEFMRSGIALPSNYTDSLDTKPTIQATFRDVYNAVAPINTDQARLEMVNFYAYLHGVVEPEVAKVLDALDEHDLTEHTIVFRFSDHGEQAMSHGMVEKMFTGYEETIHVPLIVSNPVLFPEPARTEAFWSHVDLLPTLAALAEASMQTATDGEPIGTDMTPVLADPGIEPNDNVVFSFDDSYGAAAPDTSVGGQLAPYIAGNIPSHIRLLRERSWKYAVYFTPDGSAIQYEMYNLDDDAGELTNLAWTPTTGEIDAERQRLHRTLTSELESKGCLPDGFDWPGTSGPSSASS